MPTSQLIVMLHVLVHILKIQIREQHINLRDGLINNIPHKIKINKATNTKQEDFF